MHHPVVPQVTFKRVALLISLTFYTFWTPLIPGTHVPCMPASSFLVPYPAATRCSFLCQPLKPGPSAFPTKQSELHIWG